MFDATQRLLSTVSLVSLDYPVRERRLARIRLGGRRYFHAAVLGGGTLINPLWLDKARVVLEQDVPIWTLGTGVGSCGFTQPHDVDIGDWVSLLGRFQRLGVRGPRSKRALNELGIERAEVVGDLALALAQETPDRPADPQRFAVNVYLPWSDSGNPERYPVLRSLRDLLRDLVRAGWRAVPVAMHREDLPTLHWLMEEITGRPQSIDCLDNCTAYFAHVKPCAFSIAVRLHAAVLSCCAGVPPLMLGYRDKCLDFMESMELDDWYLDFAAAEPETVAARVRQLVEVAPGLRESVLARAQLWQSRLRDYVRSMRIAQH